MNDHSNSKTMDPPEGTGLGGLISKRVPSTSYAGPVWVEPSSKVVPSATTRLSVIPPVTSTGVDNRSYVECAHPTSVYSKPLRAQREAELIALASLAQEVPSLD